MGKQLKDFHHYKGKELNKFEKIEKKVMELIYASSIPDENREDSKLFEFMHTCGCTAIGRLLAEKRKLNVDLASVACVLHDISVIISGTYEEHGKRGAEISAKILKETGEFTDNEIRIIANSVLHHSEKEITTSDPYVELLKDVDAFECSLYKSAEGYYKLHKASEIYEKYVERIKNVRTELGLTPEEIFR